GETADASDPASMVSEQRLVVLTASTGPSDTPSCPLQLVDLPEQHGDQKADHQLQKEHIVHVRIPSVDSIGDSIYCFSYDQARNALFARVLRRARPRCRGPVRLRGKQLCPLMAVRAWCCAVHGIAGTGRPKDPSHFHILAAYLCRPALLPCADRARILRAIWLAGSPHGDNGRRCALYGRNIVARGPQSADA